jgi:hypothetical protein
MLPAMVSVLRASRLPCSCGPFVTISPLFDGAARLLLTLLCQGRSAPLTCRSPRRRSSERHGNKLVLYDFGWTRCLPRLGR